MTMDAYRRHLVRARLAIEAAVGETLAKLPQVLEGRQPADLASRQLRMDVLNALGRFSSVWVAGFADAFGELVEASTAVRDSVYCDLDSLAIMDDQRVQEEIEVVRAGQVLADESLGPLLRLRRMEAMLRADTQGLSSSPVGPGAIARALWRSTGRLPLSLPARSEAIRSAASLLAPRLEALYLKLVDAAQQEEGIHLEAHPMSTRNAGASDPEARRASQRASTGLDPSARPGARGGHDTSTAASPPASATNRHEATPARPPAPPPAPRPVVGDAWASVGPAAPRPFDVTRPGALLSLLDSRAASLRAIPPTQPMPLEGDGARIPQLIRRNQAQGESLDAPGSLAQTYRLVDRIFDEIVTDPVLGPDGGPWIGRLQPAVLRLAQTDDELLRSHRHPAWILVNQLATIFSAEPAVRPPNLAAWLERATTVLRNEPTRERFEAVSRRLLAWRDEFTRRRVTEMAPVVDLLRLHEQLAVEVDAARQRLERRLVAGRSDDAVRRFVNSVWALVCAQQDSGAFVAPVGVSDAWDTATDLIWSTSAARSRLDSPTLTPMIPGLVERLREGMARLALSPAVRDAWLERLAGLHLKALQRSPDDAQTNLPLTIDLAIEELRGGAADSGFAPLDAATVDDGGGAAPSDPDGPLEIGDAFSMQVQGEWMEVTLVWRSHNGHFLLLERPDGRTFSVTLRSLDRLVREGLAARPGASSALARAALKLAQEDADPAP